MELNKKLKVSKDIAHLKPTEDFMPSNRFESLPL
jgi:hypothetical protein